MRTVVKYGLLGINSPLSHDSGNAGALAGMSKRILKHYRLYAIDSHYLFRGENKELLKSKIEFSEIKQLVSTIFQKYNKMNWKTGA